MTHWISNAKVVLPIAVLQSMIYLTINHHPIFTPQTLPLTELDEAIPFWPWTMWLYFGFIIGQIGMAISIRERDLFRRAVFAYVAVMIVTLLIHLLWPTYIVRPDPQPDGRFYTWAYRLMLNSDTPNSCFPSAHICGPVVIFWAYWRDGRPMGFALFFIALPILTLSILTTKQHYVWDWLGGWVMGILGIGIARLSSKRSRTVAHA